MKFGIGGTYWTELEKKQNAVKDKEAVQPSEETESAKSSDLATTPIASTVTFGESSRVCENKEHSQSVSAKIFDQKQKRTKGLFHFPELHCPGYVQVIGSLVTRV